MSPGGAALLLASIVLLFGVALLVLLFRQRGGDPMVARELGQLTADLRGLAQQQEAVRGEVGQTQLTLAKVAEQAGQTTLAQAALAQSLSRLQESFQSTLTTAQSALGQEISQTREMLGRLQAEEQERAKSLEAARESLLSLERVLAGSKSRGTAGENIVAAILTQLPPELREVNLTIGGKTVEFALRLPRDKYLPIDSKWTSAEDLKRLGEVEDEAARRRLIQTIQRDVQKKVEEVTKYLDPEKTLRLGVVALPDAVYEHCLPVHAEAYRQGVILIGYSQAIPFLLAFLQLTLRFGTEVDTARLSAALTDITDALGRMDRELEGRFADALTRLRNSREELGAQLARARQNAAALAQPTEASRPARGESDSTPRPV
jgi:DNA recombination protein RmuC